MCAEGVEYMENEKKTVPASQQDPVDAKFAFEGFEQAEVSEEIKEQATGKYLLHRGCNGAWRISIFCKAYLERIRGGIGYYGTGSGRLEERYGGYDYLFLLLYKLLHDS